MNLADRYAIEAPAPAAANYEETFAYLFNEQRRRAYNSSDGLSNDDLNHAPGHGAWSIGEILSHQLYLLRMMAENLEPGSMAQLPEADIGTEGHWELEAIIAERERLWDELAAVFARTTPEQQMEKRPGVHPQSWADRPAFMRFLRPLIDYATHIGQVNYARRQLGKPVGRV
jgi:uncharacterized damage-inducible protein DinB